MDEFCREEAYRSYVTQSLQLIPQNKYVKTSYLDLVRPKEIDTRSGDEVVADIMGRAGLHFG